MWYKYKAYSGEKYMFKGLIDADDEELAHKEATKLHGKIFTYKIKPVKIVN